MDGLRGIAALLVLLYHFCVPAARGGFIGVDVFFVLSGFLITVLLCEEWDREGRVHFWGFYRRRALRLLPALVALLIVLVTGTFLFHPAHLAEVLRQSAAALLYSFNWYAACHMMHHPYVLPHTWSLSVEEQFYLIWPLVLVGALRRGQNKNTALAVALAGAMVSVSARLILWALYHDSGRVYVGFDTHADGLLLGCAIGLAANTNRLPKGAKARAWLAGLSWAGAAYLFLTTAFPWPLGLQLTIGIPLVNVSTCLILAALVSNAPNGMRDPLEWRPLVGLGRISYGLYLWHLPLFGFLVRSGWLVGRPVDPLVALVLSVGIAVVSFYGLEQFFLRWKRPSPRAMPAPEGFAAPES